MRTPELKSIYLPLARKHVTKAAEWGQVMGTDYWLTFNSGFDILAAASTATGDELAENGWVSTSLVNTAGSGADFGSLSDIGTPNHALTNASADLLSSPAIFGDYAHMRAAADIMGKRNLPRLLVAEFWGNMSVASANEPRSNWGFIVAGGSPATEANQEACISTDSSFWQLGANSSYVVSTTAVATGWNFFRIEMNRQTGFSTFYKLNQTTGLMDQMVTSAGVAVSQAIVQDVFPLKFGFHALTTNRPLLGLTHVFYDY